MKQLLKFYLETCPPCKALEPVLNDIMTEYTDIELLNIDASENSELAKKYAVRSAPTMILLDENKEVLRTMTPPIEHDKIREFLDGI